MADKINPKSVQKSVIKWFFSSYLEKIGTHIFFKDYKLHSPYGLVQFFVIFEKCTRAYLFQIAFEIWFDYLYKLTRIT